MKKMILAALAVSLLGSATAASAEPWERPDHRIHRDFIRDVPMHRWVRGERFVMAPGFVIVNDWDHFRLRPPAFGFHWVRAGDDFLLINNRTGAVVDVVDAR
jgi:Ni/Co efflux regulator RcnB